MSDQQDDATDIVSIRLRRLAVPLPIPQEEIPSPFDVGTGDLAEEGTDWQFLRSGSWFWELSATSLPHQEDRWQEIGGLFGSIGEVVITAASAAVEIELLESAIAARTIDASYGIARRFFAESQGTFLISAAHKMANLTLRTLMLHKEYPFDVKVKTALRAPVPPFSDDRRHWIGYYDHPVLTALAESSPHEQLRNLVTVLVALVSGPQWAALDDQRGQDHHRWRTESPYVRSTPRRSMWKSSAGTRQFEPPPPFATSPTMVDSIVGTSKDAISVLTPAMREFRVAWLECVEPLSGGRLTGAGTEDRLTLHPGA
jgi:hypothetical protein